MTHDQEEALEVADRVVVMNAGDRAGRHAVRGLRTPASPFVFEFLGNANVLTLCASRDGLAVRNACWRLPDDTPVPDSDAAVLYVRPHDFGVVESSAPGIDASVAQAQRTGPFIRIAATSADGVTLNLQFSHLDAAAKKLTVGDRVRVAPLHYRVFAA